MGKGYIPAKDRTGITGTSERMAFVKEPPALTSKSPRQEDTELGSSPARALCVWKTQRGMSGCELHKQPLSSHRKAGEDTQNFIIQQGQEILVSQVHINSPIIFLAPLM
ncbi:hypothetical protein U0070_019003, partial [Myodes glareolus]